MQGFGRKEAEARATTSGKTGLSFEAYAMLAAMFLSAQEDFTLAIFAHLFLLLQWNLMYRCMSAAHPRFSHLRSVGDFLQILFSKHKRRVRI